MTPENKLAPIQGLIKEGQSHQKPARARLSVQTNIAFSMIQPY